MARYTVLPNLMESICVPCYLHITLSLITSKLLQLGSLAYINILSIKRNFAMILSIKKVDHMCVQCVTFLKSRQRHWEQQLTSTT